ncbi:hypothetical protein [Microvirga rosea]|uniref:hypothetical protein n=1 Tax=Microvirga rosea TaxID=2715425 RepID=UPI001D0B7D71|nr:hypothetical protein [Microvirga rosea]MCB8823181.1 hypothetical protein [Microvirga rosea]
MKLKFAFAASATFMSCTLPAFAQNAEDVMHPLDLREPGIYSHPAVEIWKDLLDKANAERKGNPATSGQLVPGYVFAKEFKDGDTTVLASIYRAWDTVCDNGPNSSTSTVDWGTCPVRIKVTEGGRSRIVEDDVCTTITALVDASNAPDDKNYAAFIPNVGIQFNVASKGRYAKECTKLVRLDRARSATAKLDKMGEPLPPPTGTITAVYSDTQGKTCKQIVSESEFSHWSCSAPGGRRAQFMDTGLVAAVRFGDSTNTQLEPGFQVSGGMIGKKIEWRVRDGRPFAGILRYFTRGADDKPSQVLVVTKVNGNEACHIGYVSARLKNANQQAAEVADNTAHTFKCGTDRPIRIGNPQIRLESDD